MFDLLACNKQEECSWNARHSEFREWWTAEGRGWRGCAGRAVVVPVMKMFREVSAESTILSSALYNTVSEATFTFAGQCVTHQCSTKSSMTRDMAQAGQTRKLKPAVLWVLGNLSSLTFWRRSISCCFALSTAKACSCSNSSCCLRSAASRICCPQGVQGWRARGRMARVGEHREGRC